MPKIPSYRRQILPGTNVGAAPVRYVSAGEGAVGEGLVSLGAGIRDIGGAIAQIKDMDNRNKDSLAGIALQNDIEAAEAEYRKKIANDGDTNNWPGYRDQALSKINIESYDWGRSSTKQRAAAGFSGWSDNFTASSELDGISKRNEQNIIVTEAAYISKLEVGDDSGEQAYRDALSTKFRPDMVDVLVAVAESKGIEAFKEASIEDIKPEILIALGDDMSDKKSALQTAEQSLDKLKNKGLIKDVEYAEGLRKLNNYMKDVAQEYQQKQQQNIIQIYEQFADKLAEGTFTGDDIALSNLTEAEKKLWVPILEGKRKVPPAKTSYGGSKATTQTLTDYSSGVIGKKKAIYNILTERYEKQSITDDDFRFALEKIKKPYPKHIAESINGVLKSSENIYYHKGIGIFGRDWLDRSEKESLVLKNRAFLSWVELEAQEGKYPDGKGMYEKMRELGVMIATPNILPSPPPRGIPQKTQGIYITNDEDYDKLSSGTEFYDGIMGIWRIKPETEKIKAAIESQYPTGKITYESWSPVSSKVKK